MLQPLDPFDAESDCVQVIIETPKDHRNKYSYDPARGLFRLKSVLPAGHVFPFDFGFIPGTCGEDGDPLDILVLMEEPATQGCMVLSRLIGVIEAEQTEDGETKKNDRLIGVSAVSHDYKSVQSLDQMSPSIMEEIEHFFISYNQIRGRKFKPLRRTSADRGLAIIRESMRREKK